MSDWQHTRDGAQDARGRQGIASGVVPWIAFWLQLAVLAVLAVLGALFASADVAPGDYACGLILAVAAVLLMFLRVKGYFDGGPAGFSNSLLVDDMPSLGLTVIVFAALGFGGVFVAAAVGAGGLYVGGVALFAVSALAILLSMKRVFDNLDRRH
jgi:hypothetical protein